MVAPAAGRRSVGLGRLGAGRGDRVAAPVVPNVIGVDVGGTKILAGVVGSDGTIAAHREYTTPLESEEALLDGLEAAVRELLDESVVAVGFGIPSRIDQRAGIGDRLGEHPARRRSVPRRDERAARRCPSRSTTTGMRPRSRSGAPAPAAARPTWSCSRSAPGVGGGLILGGRPYRGSIGAGAELGHVVIVHDGVRCSCGGYGHLESYVSGKAADEARRRGVRAGGRRAPARPARERGRRHRARAPDRDRAQARLGAGQPRERLRSRADRRSAVASPRPASCCSSRRARSWSAKR